MRGLIASIVLVAACSKGEQEAIEAARKQQEAEARERGTVEPAKKQTPPVPGEAKLPCSQVINTEAFQTALGEKEPLTVKDVTAPKGEVASSCDLVRGGKKLTAAEQAALLKKEGRLGVLAGDVVCNVRLLCYTIEKPDAFRERCKQRKEREDETMGSFACVQVVPTGADDPEVFRFLDEDTKCVFEVRGGPSNVNNDLIRTCAKTARDTIGPAQIKVGAAPATPPPAEGSGSAAGSGS